MKAAIIGSTKIALIHYKSIFSNNFKKIYFISRKKIHAKKFLNENNLRNFEKIKYDNYKILNKIKFSLINICVNTNYHHKCLDYLKPSNKLIIVEKPLISIKIFKDSYLEYLKKLYVKHKKLIVCYPMSNLATSFLKKFKYKKKINKIEVFYYTNGKHQYFDIGIDLLPHGLSLVSNLIKRKLKTKHIKINKLKVNKTSWVGSMLYKNLKCEFNFVQKKSITRSKFFFKINNELVDRKTKIINGKFLNFLKYKNKTVEIVNPMKEFLDNSIKNKSNFSWINKNKILTKKYMKINYLFYIKCNRL